MAYIAKIALKHRGRFIPIGAKVPDAYNRLEEGIRRGWIKVVGDPAAAPSPVKVVTAPVIAETEITAPEITTAHEGLPIDDLDYLNPMAKRSLSDVGIVSVGQLEGMDAESLDALQGIGAKLAEKLLTEFEAYSATRDDAEYSNMPEEEHGSFETGEDEGAEDDPS